MRDGRRRRAAALLGGRGLGRRSPPPRAPGGVLRGRREPLLSIDALDAIDALHARPALLRGAPRPRRRPGGGHRSRRRRVDGLRPPRRLSAPRAVPSRHRGLGAGAARSRGYIGGYIGGLVGGFIGGSGPTPALRRGDPRAHAPHQAGQPGQHLPRPLRSPEPLPVGLDRPLAGRRGSRDRHLGAAGPERARVVGLVRALRRLHHPAGAPARLLGGQERLLRRRRVRGQPARRRDLLLQHGRARPRRGLPLRPGQPGAGLRRAHQEPGARAPDPPPRAGRPGAHQGHVAQRRDRDDLGHPPRRPTRPS